MKYDDIEIGTEYAVGPESYLRRAIVVDKRPDVSVTVYRDRHSSPSAPSKRALVRYVGRWETEEWVTPAQVKRLWSEQEPINAAETAASLAKKARVRALSDALGCKVSWSWTHNGESSKYVTLPVEALERLVNERPVP